MKPLIGKPNTKPAGLDVHWEYDDYDDCKIQFSISKGTDLFNGSIEWAHCCGVKEVCDWSMIFKNEEDCKEILDRFFVEWGIRGIKDMPCAWLLFATLPESKDKPMQYIHNYLSKMDGAYSTPPRLNKNSDNIIQVFMVEA